MDGVEVDTSKTLYSTECNWIQDIPCLPINDYEKDMLKNTKNTEMLLEEESKEEPVKLTDEEKEKQQRKDFINKVKVIALANLGLYPLSNPSTFPRELKNKTIITMENVIKRFNGNEEELNKEFSQVCIDKLFAHDCDYTKYPVFKQLV